MHVASPMSLVLGIIVAVVGVCCGLLIAVGDVNDVKELLSGFFGTTLGHVIGSNSSNKEGK